MARRPAELQIQIDDVYACPGNCGGCVLAADERRATVPDMRPDILDLVYHRFDEYLAGLPRVDHIIITYGIADHLRMQDEYLADICQRADDVLTRHGYTGPGNAIFFTTSLIGKTDQLLPRLERLHARPRNVPCYPIAVLDPAKLYNRNFGAVYEGNILRTKALFGQVDLAINLSDEAIARITPQDLHDFAADNGFREVTLNWTPTDGNLDRTFGNVPALTQWLFDFLAAVDDGGRIGSSLDPVFLRSIDAVYCQSHDADRLPTMMEALTSIVPMTIRHSLQIDHEGYLLPKLEAVGDMTHGSRFGLPHLGHLSAAPIEQLLDRAMPGLLTRVARLHSTTRACMQCPHTPICAINGFHVYQHVARDRIDHDSPDCPHLAAALIARYRDVMTEPAAIRQANPYLSARGVYDQQNQPVA